MTFPQVTPKNQDPPGLVVPHWSSLFVLFHWPWLFIDTAWLANHSTPPRQRGDWPRLTEYARDTDYSFQILQITVSKYCRLQFPDIADYNFQIFQITCCQDPNSTTTQTQPQLLLDFIKKNYIENFLNPHHPKSQLYVIYNKIQPKAEKTITTKKIL